MSDRKESFLIIFCTVYTCALFTVSIFVHNFFCLILLRRFSFFFVNSALKIQNLHFFYYHVCKPCFFFPITFTKKKIPLSLHASILALFFIVPVTLFPAVTAFRTKENDICTNIQNQVCSFRQRQKQGQG